MADQVYRVELTASLLERLDAIEVFLTEADAAFSFDDLLAELRATVIPDLAPFPRIGRRYLDRPPQSAEPWPNSAHSRLALPMRCGSICMVITSCCTRPLEPDEAAYSPSIRHHRQLTFDFATHWPS